MRILTGLEGQPIQPLALSDRRDRRLDHASLLRRDAKVQPPRIALGASIRLASISQMTRPRMRFEPVCRRPKRLTPHHAGVCARAHGLRTVNSATVASGNSARMGRYSRRAVCRCFRGAWRFRSQNLINERRHRAQLRLGAFRVVVLRRHSIDQRLAYHPPVNAKLRGNSRYRADRARLAIPGQNSINPTSRGLDEPTGPDWFTGVPGGVPRRLVPDNLGGACWEINPIYSDLAS